MEKSMLTVAYEVMKNNNAPMSFTDLVNKVAEILGMSEEEKNTKVAQFYTNLSLDGKFVVLANNVWDLRENVAFDKVHIDMKDAYNDDFDSDDDDAIVDDDDKQKELGDEEPIAAETNFDQQDDEIDAKAEAVKEELGD